MNDQPQWRSMTFAGKIYGIYRLPGASQWRYLKEKGARKAFPTERDAITAARDKALSILFPQMTSSLPLDDKKVAESLGVEQWLKSRREDVKKAQTLRRPGRRAVVVVRGRA